ncbi:hypothetical protein MLD52_19200 [Puniceicoccaceae bacterium K14]|nr:hypothetical protein [Puniceicoccaceae bacterium K14]
MSVLRGFLIGALLLMEDAVWKASAALISDSVDCVASDWVFGADAAGVMYGGLELVEVISTGGT